MRIPGVRARPQAPWGLLSLGLICASCAVASSEGEYDPGEPRSEDAASLAPAAPSEDGGAPQGESADAAAADDAPDAAVEDSAVVDAQFTAAELRDGASGANADAVSMSGYTDGSYEADVDAATCDELLDSDGDALSDCHEESDDSPFTDPLIFNGMRVRTGDPVRPSPDCHHMDVLGEVLERVDDTPDEELDQCAGWDFDDTGDSRTDPGYGFMPPWTDEDSTWQLDAIGFVQLAEGRHCFQVAGEAVDACAALYVSALPVEEFPGWDLLDPSTPTRAHHGSGVACFDAPAGVYPIRWHYEMDNGRRQAFHLLYCFDPSHDCTPLEALPSSLLRVTP